MVTDPSSRSAAELLVALAERDALIAGLHTGGLLKSASSQVTGLPTSIIRGGRR
jgi:hypothetical protein